MPLAKSILRLGVIALVLSVVAGLVPATVSAQDHAEPAQEDGHAVVDDHGEGHVPLVPTTTQYIYKWINFAMLAALLYWLLVVPPDFVKVNFEFEGLKTILGERSQAIVASRELAKEQTQQAAAGMDASASRLEAIEQEAAGLVATARTDAERDKARLIQEATEQAEAIRASTGRDMKSEVARAERDLQSHIAYLAVGIATDLVKKNFSGADQDRLVRQYLDRLGESVS
jgi:F-type H+-transporting ATPase subunit b